MTFDPVASRLVLLDQLEKLSLGSKVRFLGCVQSYDLKSGQLSVVDSSSTDEVGDTQIVVDINNVLESISHQDVEVGAWINVTGYIRHLKKSRRSVADIDGERHKIWLKTVEINAVMLWGAGAINPDAYRSAVLELQQHDRRRLLST